MTTTLAVADAGVPPITAEQLELIKKTVASGATDVELRLFFYDCQRQGVHPLDRLIHFTKRGNKYTPISSIDFMRQRAAQTGDCAGIGDAVFSGEPKTPAFAASVTVYRLVQGQRCAFTATARWLEYKPEANDFMWQKMPFVMLSKCAEALALRKGFPQQLAGLYAKEELDQADIEGEAQRRSDPVAPPPTSKSISTAQRKKLFAVAAECGWTEEEWRAEMLRAFGVDKTGELQQEDFDQLLAILKRRPRERADVSPEPR